jgi:hypothetical protein
LTKMGIECYCPLITQVRQWSDRKKKVVTHFLISYVFVQVADSDRSLVFQSVGAVRYLFWLQMLLFVMKRLVLLKVVRNPRYV